MSFSEKRRFLAGAVCPRCEAMDKIVVYNFQGSDYRECIACDFKQAMHFAPLVQEPATRVNRVEKDEESEVRILGFRKS